MALRGQYTYSACQAVGPYSAVPGWKVKQVEPVEPGHPLAEEVVQLAVRPFGGFKLPTIPPLATAAEVEQLPRCLRLDVLDPVHRSVAHLAAAGRDHSGRDAFFAHGLIVELTAAGSPVEPAMIGATGRQGVPRPADLWGANGWLTPFRADAIEAAALSGPPLVSSASPLDSERREDFIDLHPGQRAFVFAAVERAVRDRVPLVVVGLPVEVSMWVSLVTHLMVPSAGWSFPFSSFERTLPRSVLDAGLRVVGIPDDDRSAWQALPDDVVTLLTPNLVGRGSESPQDARFALHGGGSLGPRCWASLAESVCATGMEDAVRAEIEGLGSLLGAATDSWPLWGLGAAVLRTKECLVGPPELGRLAVDVFVAHFPAGAQLEPAVTRSLMNALAEVTGPWFAHRAAVLQAIEAGAGPAVTEPWATGYLTALLGRRSPFVDRELPLLPGQRLSAATSGELSKELPDLLAWMDVETDGAESGRALVTVARLAELNGWLEGAQRQYLAALLDKGARQWLVPMLIAGHPLTSSGWPRLPEPLWDVISDAIGDLLPHRDPGELARPEAVRRVLTQAGGPLPVRFTAGETISRLTSLDCERAAAHLLGDANFTARGPVRGEQDDILRAAAFLRTVLVRAEPIAEEAIASEIDRWFPSGLPRADLLADVIAQLVDRLPSFDPRPLVEDALGRTPPSRATASLVRTALSSQGNPAAPPGPVQWHEQFGIALPRGPRMTSGSRAANRPDRVEQALLEAAVQNRLPQALVPPARQRLARWLLLQLAASFVQPRVTVAGELNVEVPPPKWLVEAGREPLRTAMQDLYLKAAASMVDEFAGTWDPDAEQESLELAAQWAVRAALANSGTTSDPAGGFFARSPGDGRGWVWPAHQLVHQRSRRRRDRKTWFRAVREAAEMTAMAAGAGRIAPDFFENATHSAEVVFLMPERHARPITGGWVP